MAWVIEDRSTGIPVMYSMDVGKDYANNMGGWVGQSDRALQFARKQDARVFLELRLPMDAPNCTVVEVDG